MEFENEDGVDAGAIRGDFFESLIKIVDAQFFEGNEFRRIIKKDIGLETQFEVAGMIIARYRDDMLVSTIV